MGYIGQKLWDIFGKTYGIYRVKTMGNNGLKVWDILRDIFVKSYDKYWVKTMGCIG